MSSATNISASFLPIPWTITSLDLNTHTCPTPSSLLYTFAAVNGIVSLLSLLFGHRRVVEEFTCGFFGKQGSTSWKYLWVVPVGLQLSANACIAWMIQRSDGYSANFRISELMLWLTARPRLSWIVLGAFAFSKHKVKVYPHARGNRRSTSKLNVNTSYEELRGSSYSRSPYMSPYGTPNLELSESRGGLNPYAHVSSNDDGSGSEQIEDYPWYVTF